MIVPQRKTKKALSKQKSLPEIKPSSLVGLITNFKRKTYFSGDLTNAEAEVQKQIYMRITDEEFIIDLEKNNILADLFSQKEMAAMIKELIVDHLKLETNLRIACMHLNEVESAILKLKAVGHDDKKLSSKMDLSLSAIAIHKQNISSRLNKASFDEVLDHLRVTAL